MGTIKKLGICMDHSHAHLIEFTADPMETRTIDNAFHLKNNQIEDNSGERIMNHQEQQHQADYYKKLIAEIKNYDIVLLFGATNAKAELYNLIKADHRYDNTEVVVKPSDKMTENQRYAFVKDYFVKQ